MLADCGLVMAPHFPTPPRSTRFAEARGHASDPDLAFADTVIAADLDEAIPPSGLVVSDESGRAQHLLPFHYPTPTAPTDVTSGSAWARLHSRLKSSRDEMFQLWRATAYVDDEGEGFGRRVRTFWSFFEWERADLIRAAWIGLAVFALAATIGARVL